MSVRGRLISDQQKRLRGTARCTYDVNAPVDLGKAALSNMLQALELADGLLRRSGRGW
jgi:hypothetical protein